MDFQLFMYLTLLLEILISMPILGTLMSCDGTTTYTYEGENYYIILKIKTYTIFLFDILKHISCK
jgi:hypothetical protein